MDQKKIGRFIATLRKERGLSQKTIAERLGLSEKTISKWECGNGLPEVVYMEPLCEILGITVNELLAGEQIDFLEVLSKLDRSRLALMKQLELEQLKLRVYKMYGIEIDEMERSDCGAGSLVYLVTSGADKYVVKYPSENDMNHPELEPKICEHLLACKIPVCEFIKNQQGLVISVDENGRRFHVQKYIEGTRYEYNAAPVSLQKISAQILAKIHVSMKNMPLLPEGIGQAFFQYRTPETTRKSYENTVKIAIEKGDTEIANRIRSNLNIVSKFPNYTFDISKFSTGNTHGDYMISQLLWSDNTIVGVIDWTTACCHPYVWEIVRSYVFMAPECNYGEINMDALLDYIKEYMTIGQLNSYDIENAGKLFYYFLAVCDFYGQYYQSLTKNREIYLKQANLASGLLVWFKNNSNQLTEKLVKLARMKGSK